MKLIVAEDPYSETPVFSGTAVRVVKHKKNLDQQLSGQPTLWRVESVDANHRVIDIVDLETVPMVGFLEGSEAENLLMSVDDCRQLLGLILRPRVRINLADSKVEYFEWETFITQILEIFLREVNFPLTPPPSC